MIRVPPFNPQNPPEHGSWTLRYYADTRRIERIPHGDAYVVVCVGPDASGNTYFMHLQHRGSWAWRYVLTWWDEEKRRADDQSFGVPFDVRGHGR